MASLLFCLNFKINKSDKFKPTMDNIHVSKHALTSILTYIQNAVAVITEGLQCVLLQKGVYAKIDNLR